MARLQLIQPAARAHHRRPVRLSGRTTRLRLAVAARSAACGARRCAALSLGVLGRHARHASRRHQALPVRHLRRPAVPHRVPDPTDRYRRASRYDLRRSAAVLSRGLVLDRRPDGCADRHTGVGDVQTVGDHLHRHRDRAGFRVVGEHDSVRVRADRLDRDGRRDAGLFPCRAVRRSHHSAPASRAGACVVRAAWAVAGGWLGSGRRRRSLPRRRRLVLHAAARVRGIRRRHHGGGTGRRPAEPRWQKSAVRNLFCDSRSQG